MIEVLHAENLRILVREANRLNINKDSIINIIQNQRTLEYDLIYSKDEKAES